jgi:hypothetical protein
MAGGLRLSGGWSGLRSEKDAVGGNLGDADWTSPGLSLPNNFAARTMPAISALPKEERANAIQTILSESLEDRSVASILEMRDEVAQQFDAGIPIIPSALDLIDGQLAWREITGAACWR